MSDLVQGLLIVFGLDPRGHRNKVLGTVVGGAGVVTQGQLLPYIQKQLGVAGAAEEHVHHQHRILVNAVHAVAQAQLSLAHVHLLLDHTGLRGAAVVGHR